MPGPAALDGLRDSEFDWDMPLPIRDTMRATARLLVDRLFPGVGLWYRGKRDRRWLANPVRLKEGFQFCAPPSLRADGWETNERSVFDEALRSADICVDAGANVGFYACLARSRGKHVLAIEPLAQNLSFLYRNLQINDFTDVEVFPLGLASRPGIALIYGFSDIASFVPGWSAAADAKSEPVPLSTLDILLGDRFAGRRLLIKVDVEGFELDLLAGAERTLRMHPKPTWMVEILLENPLNGTVNGHFREVFDLFWRHGYRAWQIEDALRAVDEDTLARWVRDKTLGGSSPNFLFRARDTEGLGG